ncbi:MAG TPA: hypothetical protein VMV36_08635 [Ignavibacteriaceae bacterium]|nr:hypothetical protein [Ignavibacteriaceae bacterium]
MLNLIKRRTVDLLVQQFWKEGYLTVRRRFGTYLPEPDKIGSFEVDIIAKQRKNYAIGLTLTPEDFKNSNLIEKLTFLSTRQTRYSNKRVQLFVGVPTEFFEKAKSMVKLLSLEARKNIKIFQIEDKAVTNTNIPVRNQKVLFS